MRHSLCNLLIAASAVALPACGGGGGTQVASTPPPPPPPPPPPVLAPAHIGLVSSEPFAVLGIGDEYTTDQSGNGRKPLSGPSAQDVKFSYDPSTNTYQISLPDFQPGRLAETGYNGSNGQVATSSFSRVTAGASNMLQPVGVWLPVPGTRFSPYTFTSYGTWNGQTGQTAAGDIVRGEGFFAYGIPTAPGDVPVTGSASYTAEIFAGLGPAVDYPVGGSVSLLFDFAGGKLSGSMHPGIFDGFNGIFVDFGRYDFTQTVYSTGSTTFSGKFIVPNMPGADSFFEGRFTGPKAAELMARFNAPYLLDGQAGTISGVWIGKKD